ncbi:hypothetical protein L9F63_018165, partial [Diploptera punctata]
EIDKHSDLASLSDSEDSFFAPDYTQPPHDISDTDISCVDEGDIQTLTRVLIAIGLGGVSTDFIWQNMDTFNSKRGTFCDISGPQFSREDSCNGKEGKTTETVCCLCQKW